jgi:ATP-dependent helicase/nuclease subunit A
MTDPTTLPDPNILQRSAADPESSVWVSASAGTGKTKVLTDRVLALLLAGTEPHRILCLTFTRAAAAEMANRINGALAEWAASNDKDLTEALEKLTGKAPASGSLDRARALFAQVLDVPGGMKILTLHAFCESLLGRFPLEAGLAPHFQVMDEREAAECLEDAKLRVLAAARGGSNPEVTAALAEVTGHINEDDFGDLLKDLTGVRDRLRRLIEHHGSLDHLIAALYRKLGARQGETIGDIHLTAATDAAIDEVALRRAAAAMLQGSKNDQKAGQKIADWLAAPTEERVRTINDYMGAYFTQAGSQRVTLVYKAALAIDPGASETLTIEAERFGEMRERVRSAVTAIATSALLRIGKALIDAFEVCKQERGRLDYDDLILLARALLEAEGGVSWVMFKLDGGIDHILLDEAQDTNPDQWALVRSLAEEFFSGEGAGDRLRTLFVVGDPKQSIYSFQRADPDAFGEMREYFQQRTKEAESNWRDVDLDISFRSTFSVLRAVDAVFAMDDARDGVTAPDVTIKHTPFRVGQAGLVEMWPPITPEDRDDRDPWAAPVTEHRRDNPAARLALAIAGRIQHWLETEEQLKSKNRPIMPGDIMVLVRRRGAFVDELVRALKRAKVPVAGVDRMVLSEQLAVRDLVALGEFLLLPEDDLTLAVVLKGPLFGLSEDDLFDLAYKRGKQTLWRRLRSRGGERPEWTAVAAELEALLARADYVPPFELFSDVLGRRGGRRRIVARLGFDANDPVDEFLGRAFEFENHNPPSLQGFLHWLDQGDVQIKRDLDQATRNEVRVMTVHGSKGLQAPIVFLPDTLQMPKSSPRLLWDPDGLMLWPPRAQFREKHADFALARHNQRRDQEYRRLLYVAMTRAGDRLYLCGWGNKTKPPAGNWYDLVKSAVAADEAVTTFDFTADGAGGWSGQGFRITNPQTNETEPDSGRGSLSPTPATLPEWAMRAAAPERDPPRPLAPSRDDETDPAMRSPLGGDGGAAFRRGLAVHHLLQRLPDLPVEVREAAAGRYLARAVHELPAQEQAELVGEVMAILNDSEFSVLFSPESRAEVPITACIGDRVITGRLDRLAIDGNVVHIVDYKTNRPPPAAANDVAGIYLRQMAAYRAVVQRIYPGFEVRCSLLWTYGPRLMALPASLLDGLYDDASA